MQTQRVASITVIVPVHSNEEPLEVCLEALAKQTRPPEEVIVVVDGVDVRLKARAHRYSAIIIDTGGVLRGASTARNRGAAMARGEILAFVDADVRVPVDCMENLHAAIVGGNDAVFGSYDNHPADFGFISQYRNLLHHFVHQTAQSEAFTFWAGCGAIRAEKFFLLGGFDESIFGIEDIDLGYRAKERGCQIFLDKKIQVQHCKRITLKKMIKTDVFHRAIPWTRLIFRRGQRIRNDLNLKWGSRWSVVAAGTLAVLAPLAMVSPIVAGLAFLTAVGFLALNRDFYRFLFHERGGVFLIRAIPCHFLYYCCCLVGVVGGILTRK